MVGSKNLGLAGHGKVAPDTGGVVQHGQQLQAPLAAGAGEDIHGEGACQERIARSGGSLETDAPKPQPTIRIAPRI